MRVKKRLRSAIGELRAANTSAPGGLLHFPSTKKRLWALPAGLVAGGAVAAIALVTLILPAKAVGLEDIGQALKSVPASHSKMHIGGKLFLENWQEGVKRRYRFGDSIDRGYDGKVVWYVQTDKRFAVIGGEPPSGFGLNGTNVEDEIRMFSFGGRPKPEVSNSKVVIDGQEYLEVTVRPRNMKGAFTQERTVYRCRMGDKLPLRVESYRKTPKGEDLVSYRDIEYPQDIPDEQFQPDIPDGFTVCNHVEALKQIRNRLHDPAFEKTVNGVKVNFLGIFTDLDGRTFVLYAGGAIPDIGFPAGLLDGEGRGYEVSYLYEGDDRNRLRNHGVAPIAKTSKPKQRAYHGISSDFPLDLRPLIYVDGQPIYCIQAHTGRPSFREPQTFEVVLPAVRKDGMKVRHTAEGRYTRGAGKLAGTVRFKGEASPIAYFHSIVLPLDPKLIGVWNPVPLKGANIDEKRDKQLKLDFFRGK